MTIYDSWLFYKFRDKIPSFKKGYSCGPLLMVE